MGKSKIEWTDSVWQPVTGCTPISEGCRNCFAARMAATRLKHHPRYKGLATIENGKPKWTGKIRLNHDVLAQPLRWKKPRMVFSASMGDLFHPGVPFTFIVQVFDIMYSVPQHTYQVLTKRPYRMKAFIEAHEAWYASLIPNNIWLGVSVENQAAADERREYLEQCSAAVKYVSYEPALGPVDWTGWEFVSQIISGGESGPSARPSHPDWHRATRDFCRANGIAYFMKQHGAWLHGSQFALPERWARIRRTGARIHGMPANWQYESNRMYHWPDASVSYRIGKRRAGHLLDGRVWQEFPR